MQKIGTALAVYAAQGIVGGVAWWTLTTTVAPGPIRDWAVVLIWPAVIVAGTIILLRILPASPALRSQPDETRRLTVRPEWLSLDQRGHWRGVYDMTLDVLTELREIVRKTGVTLKDQEDLRKSVDSLDLQVSQYAEMWNPGWFWAERARKQWEASRDPYDGPPWAQPIWERIDYARWWLGRYDPDRAKLGFWDDVTGYPYT